MLCTSCRDTNLFVLLYRFNSRLFNELTFHSCISFQTTYILSRCALIFPCQQPVHKFGWPDVVLLIFEVRYCQHPVHKFRWPDVVLLIYVGRCCQQPVHKFGWPDVVLLIYVGRCCQQPVHKFGCPYVLILHCILRFCQQPVEHEQFTSILTWYLQDRYYFCRMPLLQLENNLTANFDFTSTNVLRKAYWHRDYEAPKPDSPHLPFVVIHNNTHVIYKLLLIHSLVRWQQRAAWSSPSAPL